MDNAELRKIIDQYVDDRYYDKDKLLQYLSMHQMVGTEIFDYVDKKSFAEGDVIVSQKDQSKYVVSDVGVLEGVYCINQGYSVFRRIEILDQNEEYAIASKSTSYGLSRYDHIVRNADKVNEEEILY